MKSRLILIIVLLITSIIIPQNAGKTGLHFLKMGHGARNIALGDVGGGLAKDVSALFYNPANLSGNTSSEIMIMHNEWVQDTRSEILGAKFSFWGLPIAVGLNSTSIRDIEVRQVAGPVISTFNANYFMTSVSTGFNIYNDIDFGFSLKYIYEDILKDNSSGYGLDFGFRIRNIYEALHGHLYARNIGKMDVLREESTKLPTDIRGGLVYDFELDKYKLGFATGVEYQTLIVDKINRINVGLEVNYDRLISVRIGYQSNYESKSLLYGFGLTYGLFTFDYALSPLSYSLGTGHTFSVNYKFN